MSDTKSMPFSRNLKIIFSNGIKVESEGSVLKVDGNWRYIKWDNGVKTWHRVEQLQGQARSLVAVKAGLKKTDDLPWDASIKGVKAAERGLPKAVKPRPARTRKGVGPEAVKALLSLYPAPTADSKFKS